MATAALTVLAPETALASVSVTPDDTDHVAGGVFGMANAGGRTFIGGVFNRVVRTPRSNVAAITSDGKLDQQFNPGTNGKVQAVAVSEDGSTVFLGGTFTEAGGAPRLNLAAVDAVTGVALAGWTADTAGTNPDVTSLAVSGNRLYVGGRFATIDGVSRRAFAAVDVTTGDVITEFRPKTNGSVYEVVASPDGSTVYAGGTFTTLGEQPRVAAGSVDATTGLATSFAPTGDGGRVITVALNPSGSRVFFSTENNIIFAYDHAVSNDPVWNIKMSGNTHAMAVTDQEMWIGGHFSQHVTSHTSRPYLASLNTVDGSVTAWEPNCYGIKSGVWGLVLEGARLHVGGKFNGFGTVEQRGYARFSDV